MYEVFTPKSKALQKHIFNFCVLKEFDNSVNYLAFPQLGTSIAFFSQSNFTLNDRFISISKAQEKKSKILVLGKYKLPLQLKYTEYAPEISINFTPTGLNYFFGENTGVIAPKNGQELLDTKWLDAGNRMFSKKSSIEKIEVLERFLNSALIEKDLTLIEDYLAISDQHPDYTLSEIADQLNVTTKTIHRWCSNCIGCSPTQFKKIVRFRNAIESKFKNTSQNLTQICFENDFYDSPHFNREFKNLAQMNPRDFFSDINDVSDQNIPYKFL
mgnify:CR=1 FL=1